MGKAYGSSPDTYRYPWEVTAKNRYSKRLVSVDYYDNEKEARETAKMLREVGKSSVSKGPGDYIVKVRNVRASSGSSGISRYM